MARRLPLLLPLLCLVAAGVAAAAPAAADAGAAAASHEVRLVLVQLKKKKKPTLFFNSSAATDAARTSRSLPASQALPLHLGVPVDRKQQSRAWRSKLKEPCSPHRAKGSLLFLVPQPQRNHQKNLLPTRRARALVLGRGRALSIIRPKRAR